MQETVLQQENGHGFCWIDIISPNFEELKAVVEQFGLHKTTFQDALDPKHLPKLENFENGIFAILRVYDPESRPGIFTVRGLTRKISIFFTADMLLSIHQQQPFMRDLKADWRQKGTEEKLATPEALLIDLLQKSVMTYEPALNHCQTQLENLETATFEQTSYFSKQEAYHLIRTASIVRRMLRMGLDVFQKMPPPRHQLAPFVKDLEETTESFLLWSGDLVENANRILQLQLSFASQRTNEASQRTNEIMRVLTVLSVFFMPLNLIAGIFGMNFERLPALHSPHGFALCLLLMIISSLVSYVWFQSKGWLRRGDRF